MGKGEEDCEGVLGEEFGIMFDGVVVIIDRYRKRDT